MSFTDLKTNCLGIKYVYHLTTKDDMHTYYSFKERFEYRFEDRDKEISLIAQKLSNILMEFDYVLYPQSSSDFLKKLLSHIPVKSFEIAKTPMEDVLKFFETLPLQKNEREANLQRLKEMGGVLKINGLKASQRAKFEPILFQKAPKYEGKGLILDDSCFSGTTMRSLRLAAPDYEYLAIFAK